MSEKLATSSISILCITCRSPEGCETHQIFQCQTCGKQVSWAEGADDERPFDCANCWLRSTSKYPYDVAWKPTAKKLAEPLRWRRKRKIFVQGDLFHESQSNEQIAAVFGAMAASPRHTFFVLTKKSKRMRKWFDWVAASAADDRVTIPAFCFVLGQARGLGDQSRKLRDSMDSTPWPLPVWLGVSVENQAAAEERIEDLLYTPAVARWLSCEPLLGRLEIKKWLDLCGKCHVLEKPTIEERMRLSHGPALRWVVAGCATGSSARPTQVEWFRALRDQCASAGVPFRLSQAVGPISESRGKSATARTLVIYCGPGSKRKSGGIVHLPYLDGRQHTESPE